MQDLEKHYDIESNKGVLITSVEKGSPAELAGMKPEDILLAVNGKPVNARFPEQLAAARKLIPRGHMDTKPVAPTARTRCTRCTTAREAM